jgi:hypothetical protein
MGQQVTNHDVEIVTSAAKYCNRYIGLPEWMDVNNALKYL